MFTIHITGSNEQDREYLGTMIGMLLAAHEVPPRLIGDGMKKKLVMYHGNGAEMQLVDRLRGREVVIKVSV